MVCLDLGDLALDAVPSNARTTHNDFLLFHWHCDSKRDATNAECAENPSPRRLPWFQPCVSTLLAPGGGLGYSETEMIWMGNYVNRLNECAVFSSDASVAPAPFRRVYGVQGSDGVIRPPVWSCLLFVHSSLSPPSRVQSPCVQCPPEAILAQARGSTLHRLLQMPNTSADDFRNRCQTGEVRHTCISHSPDDPLPSPIARCAAEILHRQGIHSPKARPHNPPPNAVD